MFINLAHPVNGITYSISIKYNETQLVNKRFQHPKYIFLILARIWKDQFQLYLLFLHLIRYLYICRLAYNLSAIEFVYNLKLAVANRKWQLKWCELFNNSTKSLLSKNSSTLNHIFPRKMSQKCSWVWWIFLARKDDMGSTINVKTETA